MAEYRIQNQIALYMTNKKLCEFNSKLQVAPVEFYGHVHAQREKIDDRRMGTSAVGIVLQDYSNGKGDKTVRVAANLAPEFFGYALMHLQRGVDKFEFYEEKIFGEPNEQGKSMWRNLQRTLTQKELNVLFLRQYGYSYREIGAMCRCSENAVKCRFSKLRKRLKKTKENEL